MQNIWEFLLQTLTASVVAGLLLLVKWLLADKLSPRWQYGVWSILALRLLLPASAIRHVLLPLSVWLETCKGFAESAIQSAYAAPFEPIAVQAPVPWLQSAPKSLTDWLFVLYFAGVLLTLLSYLVSYLRLRLLLRHSAPVSQAVTARLNAVCETYRLKSCRAVTISGLPSAFVCGVLRPVLVLPAGEVPDEKILLHELLHLKHRDALQSILWCVMRALHWCNPFLLYVFRRIANDMESLCDQRVLERLEGEARREYGGILLQMANERYPRLPGTTSLSNGGKNIARRITAIVRFKLYPRGMALVSVCICFVLALPLLLETTSAFTNTDYAPNESETFARGMAIARLNRCTTVAGALDTYAKGLMLENGVILATASSLSRHEAMIAEMRHNTEAENWVRYHLDAGPELEYVDVNRGYEILQLQRLEDGSYEAYLAFSATSFLNPDGEGWLRGADGESYGGCVLVPVTVHLEDAWVVEERAPKQILPEVPFEDLLHADILPPMHQYAATGESGTVTIRVDTRYVVNNDAQTNHPNFFGSVAFDPTVKTDAEFEYAWLVTNSEYHFGGGDAQRASLHDVGVQVMFTNNASDTVNFPAVTMRGDTSGSSGNRFWSNQPIGPDWDGSVRTGGGGTGAVTDNQVSPLPYRCAARIYWNGEPIEDLMLEVVS